MSSCVAIVSPVLHNNVVDDPFSGELLGVPHGRIFAQMDPSFTLALTRMDTLAVSISEMTAGTLEAAIGMRDHAPHEVAAHVLLAGTVTIMAAHRPSFKTLGNHMRTAVDATAGAWTLFGATGNWSTPPHLTPPAMTTPTLRIEPTPARALNAGQNIDADYTDDVLGRVRTVGDSFADAAREAFTTMVRNELPVGELADAIDVTMVEHMRIAADLTAALQHNLHQLANTVETSYQDHKHTDLWAAPAVTMTAPVAIETPGRQVQPEGASSR